MLLLLIKSLVCDIKWNFFALNWESRELSPRCVQVCIQVAYAFSLCDKLFKVESTDFNFGDKNKRGLAHFYVSKCTTAASMEKCSRTELEQKPSHQTEISKLFRFVFILKPLPEWPVLPSIINVKVDFELLPQIGAHQTLHMDKQVMGASGRRCLLFTMAMLHLQQKGRHQLKCKVGKRLFDFTCQIEGGKGGGKVYHSWFNM